jgi:5-methylthioribose kinase
MSYRALNEHGVPDYLMSRPEMAQVFPRNPALSVREVGDGNLNQVFIIEAADGAGAAVLKQALPYLRVAGESWPLTRERMRFESAALMKHGELAPGRVPVVYDYDDEMSAVLMEYLGSHEIMRRPLVARRRFPLFVEHITDFIARSLFFTSDLALTGIEKKELQARFINPHLCKIQEDFVFTHPYMESAENKWNPLLDAEVKAIRANGALKLAIAEVKEGYVAHAQALIHSDLHTGSIMVNQVDTRVIDPEFAFFGPMGYDLGALIANLVINFLSHFAHTPDVKARTDYQEYLLETVRGVWLGFAGTFDRLWQENVRGELMPPAYWDFPGGADAFAEFRRRYLASVFHDSVGNGGCKILRRMMGIVSVWDITSIGDFQRRLVPERLALRIGARWLLERNAIRSIDDMIGIVREESASA